MIGKILKFTIAAAFAATAIHAYRARKSYGSFCGIPFDFRVPTIGRIRERMWNPDDPRVITPTAFGAGWSINLYQAGRDMGLIRPDQGRDQQ